MRADARADARAGTRRAAATLARTALGLGTAGVFGSVVGSVVRRHDAALASAVADALREAARTPVWVGAQRIAGAIPAPEAWQRWTLAASAVLAFAVVVARVAVCGRPAPNDQSPEPPDGPGAPAVAAPRRRAFRVPTLRMPTLRVPTLRLPALPLAAPPLPAPVRHGAITRRPGRRIDRGADVAALAAQGLARAEIARRTGLSREAVALSLALRTRQS